ncbi:MAG: molybdenum cofactor guanylyltransferase [Planctomycetota bacterium]
MPDDVIAIVPAGGRSSRMGALVGPGGKAALEIAGDSMLARVCRTLAGEVGRVIVVAAAGQPLPALPAGVEIIRDRRPAAGPLAAIHDGLVHAGAGPKVAVIASCDVPDIAPEVIRVLVAAAREPGVRWAVPVVRDHPQVLVSAVATDLADTIAAAVAAGRLSPRLLLADLRREQPASIRMLAEDQFTAVDPALASFADIDTPGDLPAWPRR